MLLILLEGGWEWTRLTKSIYISIEITCLSITIPYQYTLPCGPSGRGNDTGSSPVSFSLSKLGVSFVAVLKKSKKRKAKTPLLKIWSTPIALAALPAVLFASRFLPYVTAAVPPLCHFRSENLHFVCGYPKKIEKTSSENTTFENSKHPYRTCRSSG